ncbi:MAG: sigma-70 family RNA polymerase sigma factor [Bacteroides sp.]|nr:sigma-70 family RNA polymerase sigma factor [Bacteroides sp.]MCM1379922.1 sigma-70 family RNA polymerase sigma factor [Bacteroides sp.]MCM1446223.1 sigma-70 family RNA polymerase sigma factor [Prevotella sp.]
MSANTDKSLEERLRDPQTRREAFGELLAQFSEPLYWQIRRMVSNHDDADDLLQNTFMKAWQAMDDFRGDAKLSTWLHKIAINEALTFIDKQKRRQTESLDDAEHSAIHTLETDDWIDGDEAATALREAVDSLPEKQRLVFNMKYFDEMKYEDIAEITGTTVGALKATYHFAVKKIEQFLENRS